MPSVSVGSSAMPTGNGAVTGDRIEAVYSIVDDARRNYLITLTYSELSTALRALIGPHASWCTFSTWSSRTIGYYIRGDIDPLTDYRISRLPLWLRRIVRKPAAQFNRLTSRFRKRAAPRLLARGNREIFAEIRASRGSSPSSTIARSGTTSDGADTERRSCRRRQLRCSPRPTSTAVRPVPPHVDRRQRGVRPAVEAGAGQGGTPAGARHARRRQARRVRRSPLDADVGRSAATRRHCARHRAGGRSSCSTSRWRPGPAASRGDADRDPRTPPQLASPSSSSPTTRARR